MNDLLDALATVPEREYVDYQGLKISSRGEICVVASQDDATLMVLTMSPLTAHSRPTSIAVESIEAYCTPADLRLLADFLEGLQA